MTSDQNKREMWKKASKKYRERNPEKVRASNRAYARTHNKQRYLKTRDTTRYPWRSVWEQHFGIKIPDGYHIHHKDGNKENNDPYNLLCLPKSEHAKLHYMKGDLVVGDFKW